MMKTKKKMKNKLYSFFEMSYSVVYIIVALIAGIILYPLSFLAKKTHYEEDGYDVWNMYSMKLQKIMTQ